MTTMKAMRMHEYGPPAVLRFEDAPRPNIEDDQLLIKVRAVGMNPLDWKIRSGLFKAWAPEDLPQILGFDMAGEVAAIGANVTQFAIGDAVYGTTDMGAYAEYVVVRVADVALKPRSIDFIHAAVIPSSAITAWQALLHSAQLAAGQTVLIHGAAGGVGTFAVQIAKWCGARVIGTASAHNHDFLRQLGADEVIDYNITPFEDVVRDVDVVFDTIGGATLRRSCRVIKPGGKIRTIADETAPEVAAQYGVDVSQFDIELPAPALLAELARLVDAGHIKPIITTVLPLSEAPQAHMLSASGHVRGKIVLQVTD
jgi:NADPH:quinone reductase-like Zn-dependent oxidoreductase